MTSNRVYISRFRTAAAVLFASAVLLAQPVAAAPPGPDGNRGHLNRLLHDPAVVAYLGLTDEQARAAQAVSDAVIESHRAAFETALKPETKAERVPLVKDVFISVNAETFERLEQIEMQTFGVRAFGRPAVVEYLDLTASQRERLDKIGNAMGDRLSGIHRSSDLSAAEKKEATGKIRLEAISQARQAVSAEQWVKWELLTGAEFRR